MNKVCKQCNNKFWNVTKCHYSKKTWDKVQFCSVKCSGLYRKGENLVTLECRECKGYFKVRNYRKDTARFCSQQCSHQNRNEGNTPINKKIRLSSAYKAWRTLVFERDNYTCQECKKHGGYLHADHIKPFAFYPELRFEVNNGRTLCVSCHTKTPTYGANGYRLYKKLIASAQEA